MLVHFSYCSPSDQRTVFPFGIGRGDFDGGSNIVIENRDDDPDNGFSITSDSAFFGKCILMQVDTAHPLLDIATEKVINIPVTGSPEVWVEMHYKCDVPYFMYIAYPNGGGELSGQFISSTPPPTGTKSTST
jgi:hypothetical protein